MCATCSIPGCPIDRPILRCRCDGGSYQVRRFPFLHSDCPIHSKPGRYASLT